MEEFKEYNDDYKVNSPLRLDLDDLGNKFDSLVKQTLDNIKVPAQTLELFETCYKPYLDQDPYQYKRIDSSQRKQETIESIKLQLGINAPKAEFIFNKIKTEWPNDKEINMAKNVQYTLNHIYADILMLDSRVGFLGGETRTLNNGKKITIPKNAVVLFDSV